MNFEQKHTTETQRTQRLHREVISDLNNFLFAIGPFLPIEYPFAEVSVIRAFVRARLGRGHHDRRKRP